MAEILYKMGQRTRGNYFVTKMWLEEAIVVNDIKLFFLLSKTAWQNRRHDTQHNYPQHKGLICDTQYKGFICDTQHDTQHGILQNDIQNNNAIPLSWVSHFIDDYTECQYAKCCYAECRYAECSGTAKYAGAFHPCKFFQTSLHIMNIGLQICLKAISLWPYSKIIAARDKRSSLFWGENQFLCSWRHGKFV